MSPTVVSGGFPDGICALRGLKEMGLVMPCCIKPEEPEGSRKTWLERDGFGDAVLHKTRRTQRKSIWLEEDGFGDAVLHKTRRTQRKPLTKNNHYHNAHSTWHESHQGKSYYKREINRSLLPRKVLRDLEKFQRFTEKKKILLTN
ncbi:hypothetical protein C1H46_011460 [Malus baccata]|uniref:Uncharacterized protein n=1 Tax=Malus baccata TaxID=106549 RepID=A0A540MVU5_MALBA|nr:hypothetical protein C1H46_011460 [Malus baccata]